jgi:hypothetical protein
MGLFSTRPATYEFRRLGFKADVIEPLRDRDSFRVVTPVGTFQMTKAESIAISPTWYAHAVIATGACTITLPSRRRPLSILGDLTDRSRRATLVRHVQPLYD